MFALATIEEENYVHMPHDRYHRAVLPEHSLALAATEEEDSVHMTPDGTVHMPYDHYHRTVLPRHRLRQRKAFFVFLWRACITLFVVATFILVLLLVIAAKKTGMLVLSDAKKFAEGEAALAAVITDIATKVNILYAASNAGK